MYCTLRLSNGTQFDSLLWTLVGRLPPLNCNSVGNMESTRFEGLSSKNRFIFFGFAEIFNNPIIYNSFDFFRNFINFYRVLLYLNFICWNKIESGVHFLCLFRIFWFRNKIQIYRSFCYLMEIEKM
jgi:hypothetical protein